MHLQPIRTYLWYVTWDVPYVRGTFPGNGVPAITQHENNQKIVMLNAVRIV